jgi:hypothetical protein
MFIDTTNQSSKLRQERHVQNMPLLTELGFLTTQFYKHVAPLALDDTSLKKT